MLNRINYFLKFYFEATTLYNVHSPYVYRLVHFLFHNKLTPALTKELNSIRQFWLNCPDVIENKDLGAGSSMNANRAHIAVKDIAATAMSGSSKLLLLHNLAQYFTPKLCVELGTSLGMSAACLATHSDKVVTIEGNPQIANLAQRTFAMIQQSNVETLVGNFDDLLPEILKKDKPDLIYVDGNHTYEATISYFQMILEHPMHNDLVVIFDDIYWSAGMFKAWKEIQTHKSIRLTINVYHFGIVFFNQDIISPRHYTLVPSKWKPWHIGFAPVKSH